MNDLCAEHDDIARFDIPAKDFVIVGVGVVVRHDIRFLGVAEKLVRTAGITERHRSVYLAVLMGTTDKPERTRVLVTGCKRHPRRGDLVAKERPVWTVLVPRRRLPGAGIPDEDVVEVEPCFGTSHQAPNKFRQGACCAQIIHPGLVGPEAPIAKPAVANRRPAVLVTVDELVDVRKNVRRLFPGKNAADAYGAVRFVLPDQALIDQCRFPYRRLTASSDNWTFSIGDTPPIVSAILPSVVTMNVLRSANPWSIATPRVSVAPSRPSRTTTP